MCDGWKRKQFPCGGGTHYEETRPKVQCPRAWLRWKNPRDRCDPENLWPEKASAGDICPVCYKVVQPEDVVEQTPQILARNSRGQNSGFTPGTLPQPGQTAQGRRNETPIQPSLQQHHRVQAIARKHCRILLPRPIPPTQQHHKPLLPYPTTP